MRKILAYPCRGLPVLLLAWLVSLAPLFIAGCGQNADQGYHLPESYANTSVETRDIKLLADFQKQTLFSRGHRVYLESLKLQGAAGMDAAEGLSVYKGGVNEVPDPSFEGSGWELFAGAAIDSSTASVGKKSLKVSGDGSTAVVAELSINPHVVATSYFDTITAETLQASRTLTFDQSCSQPASGVLKVRMTALDGEGKRLGEQDALADISRPGWNRNDGLIYIFPDRVAAYRI